MTQVAAPATARFHVDPSVRRGGFGVGGAAPEGHARRCQARSRLHRGQCKRWARKGSSFCTHHRGNRGAPKISMPWYGRKAGSRVAELMKDMSGDAKQLLDLQEEVQLARVLANRAVEMYEAAHFGEAAAKVSDDTKALAAANLRAALDHVTVTVEKATKVRVLMAEGNGSIDAEDIRTLATTLTANVIEAGRKLGLGEEQVAQLAKAIEDSRVPDGARRKTVVVVG